MSKWPKPYDKYHEPPEVIYLGVDFDTGKLQVSWWIWRMQDDDIPYVRKDIADKKIKDLKDEVRRLGRLAEELGEVQGRTQESQDCLEVQSDG